MPQFVRASKCPRPQMSALYTICPRPLSPLKSVQNEARTFGARTNLSAPKCPRPQMSAPPKCPRFSKKACPRPKCPRLDDTICPRCPKKQCPRPKCPRFGQKCPNVRGGANVRAWSKPPMSAGEPMSALKSAKFVRGGPLFEFLQQRC